MQSDAKQVEINEYAETCINRTAKGLVGKTGLTKSDVEDMEQELRLELLKRLPGFDPARASLNTFVMVVIRTHAKKILEYRSCEMRNRGREEYSLNLTKHDGGNRWIECGDLISREEDDRRLGDRSERDRRDMVLDVKAVLSRLPAETRRLCNLVKTLPVAEAARRLGMPESTAYKRLTDLRSAFHKAGLDDYLGNPR